MLGRWYGLRGERFVRPELILHASDGAQRRTLAELDDKPWAAQDGDPWRARFALDGEIEAARAVELSVGPNIIVALRGRPPRRVRAPERRPRIALDPAPATAAPAGAADPATPRRPDPDAERLASRLATAEASLQRERERREQAEQALERGRSELRELGDELGEVRVELARAQAVATQREASATSEALDSTRRAQHSAQARYEALASEHERTLRAQDRVREQLQTRTDELAAARESLRAARQELGTVRAQVDDREPPAMRAAPSRADAPGPRASTPHSDRPLNPSLRSRSWPLRLLAVIVMAAVVVAVYVILHSTVLH